MVDPVHSQYIFTGDIFRMSYNLHTLNQCVTHEIFSHPSASSINVAIKKVEHLSPTQKSVLSYLTQGLSNKEIANIMCIAPETVKAHCSCIFKKLDVNNRTQAAILGYLVNIKKLLSEESCTLGLQ